MDVAILGQLSNPSSIGAIAVGKAVFSAIYWLFTFLRIDTTGLVAQAFGAEENKEIKLNVIDQGKGFKEKDTNKIFKRFYSNRPDKFGEHSGLGLNIVKNLVDIHEGKIFASNRENNIGAEIEINFPRA